GNHARLEENVRAADEGVLVAGIVLRNEAVDAVVHADLQELDREELRTKGDALLAVTAVRDLGVAVEVLIGRLHVGALNRYNVEFVELSHLADGGVAGLLLDEVDFSHEGKGTI